MQLKFTLRYGVLLTIGLNLLMLGCNHSLGSSSAASTSASSSPSQTHLKSLQDLKPGMPYTQVRQFILETGWQPIYSTATDDPASDAESLRGRGYSETASCSGVDMETCRFEFSGAGDRKLVVITRGRNLTLQSWSEEPITQNSKPNSTPAALPKEPRTERSPWQSIESMLRQDLPYADVRQFVLTSGWNPAINPDCKTNVGGTAAICDELAELEACSGDGYCKMRFNHRFQPVPLTIITYGDYQGWNSPRSKDKLKVKTWEFAPQSQAAPSTSH
jgi:hypothetical protein